MLNSPKMNQLILDGKEYRVPGCYNELSKDQLLKIVAILHGNHNLKDAKLMVLLILLNVKKDLNLQWKMTYMTDEQIYDATTFTDFVFEKQNGLTKNLLPQIFVGHKFYYGPSDNCSNLVFIELIKAFTAYENYIANKDVAHLNRLVAILYRPKKLRYNPESEDYDGDIRAKYNDHLVQLRANYMKDLAPPVKLAILMFFDACRERIIASFPHVFKKADTPSTGTGSSSGSAYADLLRKMAGSPMNYEKMAYVPATTALYDLNETIAEDKERERKSKLKKK